MVSSSPWQTVRWWVVAMESQVLAILRKRKWQTSSDKYVHLLCMIFPI
jgi:hypothetical protein